MKKNATMAIAAVLCAGLLAACGNTADTGRPRAENIAQPIADQTAEPAAGNTTSIETGDELANEPAGQDAKQAQTFLDFAIAEFAGLTTEQLREKLPADAVELETLDYLNEFVFPYTLYGVEGYISVGTTTSERDPEGMTHGLAFIARGVGYDVFKAAAEEISADDRVSNAGFYHSQPYQVGGPEPTDPQGLDEMGVPEEFDPMALTEVERKTFYVGTGEVSIGSFNTYFGIGLTTEGCTEPYLDSLNAVAGTEYPVFDFTVSLFPQA